ncbi:MAG TPA: hypothetical protein VFT50_08515 [Baekduia sp.]|nr:hypothetical protein [Baekduia sp.]
MSFFDDEPDEPTRVTRPARPRRSTASRSATLRQDPDVVQRRRLVALAAGAVLVIILIFAVKGCAGSAHRNALKEYNRQVSAIVQDSDGQVSRQLFDVLGSGGAANDIQVAVNQVRSVAEEDAKRARALDVPGGMSAAQRNLELVMNLRAEGVTKIGEALPVALSNQPGAQTAIREITGQMQSFLASDVVYSQRVRPLIQETLADNGVTGQDVASSHFLRGFGWLDLQQVGNTLNPDAGAGTGRKPGEPTPGTHGHGLVSVSAGGVDLVPGGTAVNRVPASAPIEFDVTLANQGENDESDVKVTVKVAAGGAPITVTKRLDQTTAGQNAEVALQLTKVPPRNTSAKVTVTIEPVPGEKVTDNNTATYTVLFT